MLPEPPTPGGVILDDVVRFVRRFVVLSEHQADTLALWIAHTHAIEAADTTPYIWITSALKRSGKSRLLEVLELIVRAPEPTMNATVAALFRAIENLTPTLLFDEVDAIFGPKARDNEDLRGILNCGFRRGNVVRRCGGPRMDKLETFSVFCPKALAGIGKALPDTITDRAVRIRLERRTREEPVERFRRRVVAPEADELRDRLDEWITPQIDELHRARPQLPEELDDRAHALSKLLTDFQIKTMTVKVNGKTVRGYKREQFADAFHRVLGVPGVTAVTSGFPSHAEGNAGNAGNALPTGASALDRLLPPANTSTNGREQSPYPGDDGFLGYLADVHQAGQITTGEALEREGVHALILRSRARPAGEGIPF